jgi:hypothetical protein
MFNRLCLFRTYDLENYKSSLRIVAEDSFILTSHNTILVECLDAAAA